MAPKTSSATIDNIVAELRKRIIGNTYKAGQPLREVEMSREFNVSRTPIREAFRILQADGLITSNPNKGVIVCGTIDEKDIADQFIVYRVLASESSYYAALNATEEDKATLKSIYQQMEELAHPNQEDFDYLLASELDHLFHIAISKASTNKMLHQMIQRITELLHTEHPRLHFQKKRFPVSLMEHRNILDSILQGDAESAREYTSIHFRHSLISNRNKVRDYRQSIQ